MFNEPDIRQIGNITVEVESEEQYQQYLQFYSDVTFEKPKELKRGTVYSSSNGVSIIEVEDEKYSFVCPSEIEEGKEIDVVITNFDGNHYYVSRGAAKEYKQNTLFKNAIGTNEVFNVKVDELIENGGYICTYNDIKMFMPGKESHLNVRQDFEVLLGQELPTFIINYSQKNNTYICSHKAYLKNLRKERVNEMAIGQKYMAKITNIKRFGIFVNFNEIFDGLLHRNELKTKYWKLFSNNELKVGYDIPVWIKDIETSDRIVLTQKKSNNRYEKHR